MAKSPFIDDGYTEEFVLPASQHWPEVRGTFRPIPGPDMAKFLTRTEQADAVHDVSEKFDATLDVLAMAVKSWDLKARNGDLVALSKESLGRLRMSFATALFMAINPRAKAVNEGN